MASVLIPAGVTEGVNISFQKGCLSQDEMVRMVADAEKFKAEDEDHRKRLEARNDLESYAYKQQKVACTCSTQCTVDFLAASSSSFCSLTGQFINEQIDIRLALPCTQPVLYCCMALL